MAAYPPRTPSVVKHAIAAYRRRRLTLALISIAISAAGLALIVVEAGMIVDRFWELGTGVREVFPMAVYAVVLLAVVAALMIILRISQLTPKQLAIRLDNAFPENQDLLSTSLDVAQRLEAGESFGNQEIVDRVLERTQSATDVSRIASAAKTRSMTTEILVFLSSGLIMGCLYFSSVFNTSLLWQRFWAPDANLPRDSYTQIAIDTVNNAPFAGQFEALPESSAFDLHVTVSDSREGVDPSRIPPVLEIAGDNGWTQTSLYRDGTRWLYRLPRITESMRFRLRAGDALTQEFTLAVIPRIRFDLLTHSIRYPRYSKMDAIKDEPLEAKRLAMLIESNLEISVICDSEIASFSASFEPLRQETKEPTVASRDDLLKIGRGGDAHKTISAARELRTRKRSETRVQFSMRVEDSGILRLQAVGKNGLPSVPYTIVVESIPDAPPRISVTGVESDTTIMPGEAVAFQYRAEDDLAVTDIVMNWTVAGGATSGDLSGSEYIRSDQYGGKIVLGQELIQRMNYKIYATSPFAFHLVAVDSKGQEAVSPTYNIHLMDDDHAARFALGLEYLSSQAKTMNTLRSWYRETLNQINIIKVAAGDSKTWPDGQDSLLQELEKRAKRLTWVWLDRDNMKQRYTGLPTRVDRAVMLVIAGEHLLPGTAGILPQARALPTSKDVPTALAKLEADLQLGLKVIESLQSSVAGESNRFKVEGALQKARKLSQRFVGLESSRGNQDLYTANLEFYLRELDELLTMFAGQEEALGEKMALVEAVTKSREGGKPEQILPALNAMIDQLSLYHPEPSDGAIATAKRLAELAATSSESRAAFATGLSNSMRSRGQEFLLPTTDILGLGENFENQPTDHTWYYRESTPYGVWLMTNHLINELTVLDLDIRSGRFMLYPGAQFDRDAELREMAISILASIDRLPPTQHAAASDIRETLAPFGRLGFSNSIGSLLAPLKGTAAAYRKGHPSPTLDKSWQGLSQRMREVAKQTRVHAARVRALAADHDDPRAAFGDVQPILSQEGMSIWINVEGIEAWFRALLFLRFQDDLIEAPGPTWEEVSTWESMQLAMVELTLQGKDRIYGRHHTNLRKVDDMGQFLGVSATFTEKLADDLDTYAALLEALHTGKQIDHNFGPLFKATKTLGYMPMLDQEFALLKPYLSTPRSSLTPDEVATLQASSMGKIVLREGMLESAESVRRDLANLKPTDGPKVTKALKRLEQELGDLMDDDFRQAVGYASRAVAGGDPTQPTARHRLQVVNETLDSTINQLQSRVRLPPINTTARENRRFTSQEGIPYLWTIRGLVDNYDRRWANRMRAEELELMRSLMAQVTSPGSGKPEALAQDYARLLELRGRNLANEQRRNSGISLLEQDGGPALSLPKHIASEFIKARNRRSPEAFRERIEAFQTKLYQDMSR